MRYKVCVNGYWEMTVMGMILVVVRPKRLVTESLTSVLPGERFRRVANFPVESVTALRSSLITTVVPGSVWPAMLTGETTMASLVGLSTVSLSGVTTARY